MVSSLVAGSAVGSGTAVVLGAGVVGLAPAVGETLGAAVGATVGASRATGVGVGAAGAKGRHPTATSARTARRKKNDRFIAAHYRAADGGRRTARCLFRRGKGDAPSVVGRQ